MAIVFVLKPCILAYFGLYNQLVSQVLCILTFIIALALLLEMGPPNEDKENKTLTRVRFEPNNLRNRSPVLHRLRFKASREHIVCIEDPMWEMVMNFAPFHDSGLDS